MRAPLALFLLGTVASLGTILGCTARTPGEKIWRARCADCHGIDATGNTARYMSDPYADLTDESWRQYGGDGAALESVIRAGVFGSMPANEDLTASEMRDLLAHLRKLRGEAAR